MDVLFVDAADTARDAPPCPAVTDVAVSTRLWESTWCGGEHEASVRPITALTSAVYKDERFIVDRYPLLTPFRSLHVVSRLFPSYRVPQTRW